MNKVVVKTEDLLEKLKANRDQHRDAFLSAQAGFKNRVVEELDRRLQDAKEGKKVSLVISLPEPEDHTDDYDTVITMAEMSVDDEIEMSFVDFQRYVMDQWEWKQRATTTNTMYGVNRA